MGIPSHRGTGALLSAKALESIGIVAQNQAEDAAAAKMIAQVDAYWSHYRAAAPGPNPIRDALSAAPAIIDQYAVDFAHRQDQYLSAVRYFFGDKVAEWAHDVMTWGGVLKVGDDRYDPKWTDEAVSLWSQTFNEGYPPFFVDVFSPTNPDQLKMQAQQEQANFRALPLDQSAAIRELWTSTLTLARDPSVAPLLAYGAGGAFVADPKVKGATPEIHGEGDVPSLGSTLEFTVFASRVFGRAYHVDDQGALDVAVMRRVRKDLYEPLRDTDGTLIVSGSGGGLPGDEIPRAGRVALIAQQEAKARRGLSTFLRSLATLLAASEAEAAKKKKRAQARLVAGGALFAVVAGAGLYFYHRR